MKLKNFEKKQLEKVLSYLDRISELLITDIQQITAKNEYGLYETYSLSDVEYGEFNFFIPTYRIDFYPMSANHSQLGMKKILKDVPNGFMEDMKLDIDIDNYNLDNGDLESLNNYHSQLNKKIFNWFIQCWSKANERIKIIGNYRVCEQHSNITFDLENQHWILKNETL